MNQDQNAAISRQTVLNFRFFDVNAMMALGHDLSLSLSLRELLLLRDHFRLHELRDPTVGELSLLSMLRKQRADQPANMEITSITGTDEQQRAFADILRMHTSLGNGPLTLQAMLSTVERYLKRSGIFTHHKTPICGATAKMSAMAGGQGAAPALDLGNVSAMLAPEVAPPSPLARTLILLFPTGNAPFPLEIARFLTDHRDFGITALAAPGNEGIFPHLLALNRGFFLDLAAFAHQCNTHTPVSALSVGQNAVLLCVPNNALSRLFAEGAPIAVCGILNDSHMIQIGNGSELLLSLFPRIFSQFGGSKQLALQLPVCTEQQIRREITAAKDNLLGGIATRSGCMNALLSLIGEMIANGASGESMTLTCTLELPARADANDLSAVMPAVLELHRIAAELALPCVSPEILQRECTAPTMTVFAYAKRQAPPTDSFSEKWQTAAAFRDFTVLRRLLRHSENT